MVCISCIIRATILRLICQRTTQVLNPNKKVKLCTFDYPVLYVLRFYVVSTTILARILRCDPTFAEMSTWAFADGNKHDVISCQLVNIAINWTILRSHPFKIPIRCDNMIMKLYDFAFSYFKILLHCSKYHTATPVMSRDSYTKWLSVFRI